MPKVTFQNNEFATDHEAICAALFTKYGWTWDIPKHPIGGWLPDFLLKGATSVYVECKGGLDWDDVPRFKELQRYEDAVRDTEYEVLLIPRAPRRVRKNKYTSSILGFLYDGSVWSYAELSRWSNKVGFCHCGNSWHDRMSGESVSGSMGDKGASRPDIDFDWHSATQSLTGNRVSYFKPYPNAEVEHWEPSS